MKLLASDYDGTLNQYGMTDSLRAALQAWKDAGNLFGVVSGRCPPGLVGVLAEQGIRTDFLIAGNGTFLLNQKGEAIYTLPLPDDHADKLLDLILPQNPVSVVISNHEVICSLSADTYLRAPDGLHFAGKCFPVVHQITPCFATTEETERVCAMVNAALGDRVHAMMPTPFTFDAVCVEASKSQGLHRLLSLLPCRPSAVYTIGDSENDLDMLTDPAFVGVAMENAMPSVRRAVSHTAHSVDALIRALLTI